ncbi:Asp23/Gls24 family envelope stress response protein [Streptomyces sp. R41]|uniref:Asp23/Gls24 family envelope stress response protein n=1 Tax=Streptomyces sp. R41 TaxID=3238632 RepID=A0AB39R9X5_9ACTN
MTETEAAANAVPAGGRGATSVADRVVAKIASQAAREALRGFSESAHLVPPGRSKPHATVSVRPAPERERASRGAADTGAAERRTVLGQARVHIAVELGYPSDIGAQCGAVRRAVAAKVSGLAGMDVQQVALSVEWLHSVHTRGIGRERTS